MQAGKYKQAVSLVDLKSTELTVHVVFEGNALVILVQAVLRWA